MAEKEVTMKLKVDVQCKKCMKKVKKVLSKFPEIQDQKTDEKQNLVIIKVVCFDPEKIRDKICCKSEGSIKTIEILTVKKPPPNPPKPQPDPPKPPADPPKPPPNPPKPQPDPPKPPADPPKPPPDPPKPPPPAIGYPPQLIAVPIGTCYVPCSCFHCYHGRPLACSCVCHHGKQSGCYYGCHHGRASTCYCGCHYGRPSACYCGCHHVSTCEQSASECKTM